jgi:hypothetical protein
MRKFLIWVAGMFAALLTALRIIADWIGRTTVPEDAAGLLPAIYRLTNWISAQPSGWIYILAALLFGACARLIIQGDPAKYTRRIEQLEGETENLRSRVDQLQAAMAAKLTVSPGSVIIPDRIHAGSMAIAWTIDLRNMSTYETVEDVEVKMVECWRKSPTPNKMEINRHIVLARSGETRFNMLPGIDRQLVVARTPFATDEIKSFDLGPFDGHDDYKNLGPGLYKITVTIFARDMQPITYHLNIAFQDDGSVSFGPWTEGLPYPFVKRGTDPEGEFTISPA